MKAWFHSLSVYSFTTTLRCWKRNHPTHHAAPHFPEPYPKNPSCMVWVMHQHRQPQALARLTHSSPPLPLLSPQVHNLFICLPPLLAACIVSFIGAWHSLFSSVYYMISFVFTEQRLQFPQDLFQCFSTEYVCRGNSPAPTCYHSSPDSPPGCPFATPCH